MLSLQNMNITNPLFIKKIPVPTQSQRYLILDQLQHQLHLDLQYCFSLQRYKQHGPRQIIAYYHLSEHSLHNQFQHRVACHQQFSQSQLWQILDCVIDGLSQLQLRSIGHGCITLHDIFYVEGGGDIPLKVVYPSLASSQALVMNTRNYYSPQLLHYFREEHAADISIDIFKSDVFSLGMCIVALATMRHCHSLYDYKQCYIRHLGSRLEQMQHQYSESFVSAVRVMLECDPCLRLGPTELKEYLRNGRAELRLMRMEEEERNNQIVVIQNVGERESIDIREEIQRKQQRRQQIKCQGKYQEKYQEQQQGRQQEGDKEDEKNDKNKGDEEIKKDKDDKKDKENDQSKEDIKNNKNKEDKLVETVKKSMECRMEEEQIFTDPLFLQMLRKQVYEIETKERKQNIKNLIKIIIPPKEMSAQH